MNFKDLLMPFLFALLGTYIIQTFFIEKKSESAVVADEVRSGQTFKAPTSAQEVRPLNVEVDFVDEEHVVAELKTKIETEHAVYEFSNHGAALDSLYFKTQGNKSVQNIEMLFPSGETDRENRCFLVALDQATPYYYTLVEHDDRDDSVVLVYQAASKNYRIQKKFILFKKTYQVDLVVGVTPLSGQQSTSHARIIYTAPLMRDAISRDELSVIYNNAKGSIVSTAQDKLDFNQGWFSPTLFGAANKYFIQALVRDSNHFARRAYCKLFGANQIACFVESPVTSEPTEWHLSYYFGVKENQAAALVDSRLEEVFGYSGFWAPLARLLYALLQYLYTFVQNYGIAIILLTLLFRFCMIPFTMQAERGMQKALENQKKLDSLKWKYKNDAAGLERAKIEHIKQHGMPGMSGCLAPLVQIPIFFALNSVLSNAFELYKAPFLWINDLSAADPYYILPLLILIGMLFQAATGDSKQQTTMIVGALIFGAISVNIASGLALYFLFGALFGSLQKIITTHFKLV